MPTAGNKRLFPPPPRPLYFKSLEELDEWSRTTEAPLDLLPFPYRPPAAKANARANVKANSRANRDGDAKAKANAKTKRGKLLVCHDYKGGYQEDPFAPSYTFNWWWCVDTFVYFSHHRVTIPPPGWVTAAHRQGVKILGTLIFEHNGQPDALRLLIGKLPHPSSTSTTSSSTTHSTRTLPLTTHYARLLARLAHTRGFDGYLLNIECPLLGGVEQTRALTAWIALLRAELRRRVGEWAEVCWYDSVVLDGRLAWQDRLDAGNVPFFDVADSFFTNYTWRTHYPSLTTQYFHSLPPSITSTKSLSDIYIGIDVWGRGCHGGGGFGTYMALEHIVAATTTATTTTTTTSSSSSAATSSSSEDSSLPSTTTQPPSSTATWSASSSPLSTALFGPAWTYETIQDSPSFTYTRFFDRDRQLWMGPQVGEVVETPASAEAEAEAAANMSVLLKKGECECVPPHGGFRPLVEFFGKRPGMGRTEGGGFCTTFGAGVGTGWFVRGGRVWDSRDESGDSSANSSATENEKGNENENGNGKGKESSRGGNGNGNGGERRGGWTDVDKQSSLGDLVWPVPCVEWYGDGMPPPPPLSSSPAGTGSEDSRGAGRVKIEAEVEVPRVTPSISMSDAWNGGSSLSLRVTSPPPPSQTPEFQCIWIPIQTVVFVVGSVYDVGAVWKVTYGIDGGGMGMGGVDVDVGLAVRRRGGGGGGEVELSPAASDESVGEQPNGWMKVGVGAMVPAISTGEGVVVEAGEEAGEEVEVEVGLVVSIVTEDTSAAIDFTILLGHLAVHPAEPTTARRGSKPRPIILWAAYEPLSSSSNSASDPDSTQLASSSSSSTHTGRGIGIITWQTAVTLGPVPPLTITSLEDPIPAWEVPLSPDEADTYATAYGAFAYFNIYALGYRVGEVVDGKVDVAAGGARWIGTSDCAEGLGFRVDLGLGLGLGEEGVRGVSAGESEERWRVRYYVQGVTGRGNVLGWDECAFVDVDVDMNV